MKIIFFLIFIRANYSNIYFVNTVNVIVSSKPPNTSVELTTKRSRLRKAFADNERRAMLVEFLKND